MATIHKEFDVAVPWQFAWEAVRAVGEVHSRLAAGFVVSTVLEGSVRTVTFANGFVVKEQIVTVDDDLHRLAYASIGGRASHHNASIQVTSVSENSSRILWVTDLLPDEMKSPIAQMVEAGSAAIKKTLESAFGQVA
jgi:hypothetical protein